MSIRELFSKNSTNVRVFMILLAALSAVGCAVTPAQVVDSASCPPARTLICDAFGTERRCRCSDSMRIDRNLERLGLAPQTHFAVW